MFAFLDMHSGDGFALLERFLDRRFRHIYHNRGAFEPLRHEIGVIDDQRLAVPRV